MAKRRTKAPTVVLKFHALATPRATPIALEPAIHFLLPAGENADDPYYGKKWLDPLDPVDRAAIDSKLDPSAFITDASAFVLDWAKRVAKMDLDPADRKYLERCRDLLALAIATFNDPHASDEARHQANDMMTRTTFAIGEIKGRMATADWGRKEWPRSHTSKATAKRVQVKAQAVETRRNKIREIYAENGWPLDRQMKVKRLAEKFGVSVGTIYADLKILLQQRRRLQTER